MKKQATVLGLTLVALVVLDLMVAGVLAVAKERGMATSLVRYFEYGRSVPGKLEQWQQEPGTPGNLFDVAWRGGISDSDKAYLADAPPPVIRAYGMSFVGNILREAEAQDPELVVDFHTGPAAPANYTYALFADDPAQRRAGDVAVLGILSSSVSALFAMSNRTWAFEQPAPYTYPIFRPAPEGGLDRIDPLINSAAEERALRQAPEAAAAWTAQLREHDAFYAPVTMSGAWLDHSPFLRLIRRALATRFVENRKAWLTSEDRPAREILNRMISAFAQTARAEGLVPVVFLIQSRDVHDVDLLAATQGTLVAESIPYLATAEHFDPQDISGFLGDGHYKRAVDAQFGAAFLELLQDIR